EVITSDNVVVTVDAVVYYEATDPVKLLYNVNNFYMAATKLAQTNLRNVIGEMQLDESLTSRETINATLRDILDIATDKWGVKVVRVELQRIEPPADVTQSMHTQMKAERERRAMILEAEGERESAIARAQGFKQSAILEAEGKAQAMKNVADAEKTKRILIAEGEAYGIKAVYDAIHEGNPDQDLITLRYIDSLKEIANGNATKVFIPLELQGLSSVVASAGEVFKTSKEDAASKVNKIEQELQSAQAAMNDAKAFENKK
ncbi:MAG: SPFH domain-containing protein, partial [Coriobacteriia bacterium]|nr:SPFH domain-containing protein [Coriobacteriia bacterium]